MVGTLQEKLYDTIHGDRSITPKQIADEIDVEYSTLIRYGLPLDSSGADIPLRRWKRLLKVTHNYSTLRHIAAQCGLLVVRIPRALKHQDEQNEAVSQYMESCSKASQMLVKFFNNPTPVAMLEVSKALEKVMEESAALRAAVRTFNQFDLFED